MVKYRTILLIQNHNENTEHILNSQQISHASASCVSYGASIVSA